QACKDRTNRYKLPASAGRRKLLTLNVIEVGVRKLDHAGIAQLVERNLAKVEVASSSLVSRSRYLEKGKLTLPFFVRIDGSGFRPDHDGAIANRLCNGLQIRLAQFDSGSRLQNQARRG